MPSGPAPDWAPDIDPQMLAVVETIEASAPSTPLTQLSPFQFRNLLSPVQAVREILRTTGMPPVESKSEIGQRVLPVGPPEGILVRTYTPFDGPGAHPVIVYFHGGGWVIADLDTYDASARALAEKTGAIVVSVAYRLGPEQLFPTAHEDAFAAYRWVTENTAELGGDPNRIAIAGESAGGNLAVAVPMMAKQRGVRLPLHVVTVYPIADDDLESPSYDLYANAVPLGRAGMGWFFDHYAPDWKTKDHPLISLISADLTGLPPMTIINAEIDPLRSDGKELAMRLQAAGVPVDRRVYQGVTHEFFGMSDILDQAVRAQDFAAGQLKEAFGM